MCSPLQTGTVYGAITSAPAVADGVLYVTTDGGFVYAFALEPSKLQSLIQR
jgi:outer membrane protein assembly factor BamB